ncbi:MAG: response regulator [Planctomycetota bacterium]
MSIAKNKILFVDDEPSVLDSLRRILRSYSDVWEATYVSSSEEAWQQLETGKVDLVVLDVKMPEVTGLQLLTRIRHTPATKHIPVVMLTGLSDRALKRKALDLGADDLLNKPIDRHDLTARIRSLLRLKSSLDQLQAQNTFLERRVQERTAELFHSHLDTIWRLSAAVDCFGGTSRNHVMRVGCYSRVIAECMGQHQDFVETLFLAAPFHDIGTIGVPNAILRKPGTLGPAEHAVMQQHCRIGERILRENRKIRTVFTRWTGVSGQSSPGSRQDYLLEMAASVALSHHEHWDGTGYPQALAGENIPWAPRIVAVADAFDTAFCKYPAEDTDYRNDEGIRTIMDEQGHRFCPEVCVAFAEMLPEIRRIQQRFPCYREPQNV